MAGKLKVLWKGRSQAVEPDPRQRALCTYELLESILLYLEPPDIRNARLVSRFWNAVILRSRELCDGWQTPLKRQMRQGRILLLGLGGAGKRMLLTRWIQNVFIEWYDPTLEDSYRKQTLIDRVPWLFEFNTVHLSQGYLALLNYSVQDSDCFALVYSCSDRAAFDSIRGWQQYLLSLHQSGSSDAAREARPGALVALIATKCDLRGQEQQVSSDEGRALARELGCVLFETSAQTAYGCEQAFEGLTRRCKEAIDTVPAKKNVYDAAKIDVPQNGSNDALKITNWQKAVLKCKSIRGKRISPSTTKP